MNKFGHQGFSECMAAKQVVGTGELRQWMGQHQLMAYTFVRSDLVCFKSACVAGRHYRCKVSAHASWLTLCGIARLDSWGLVSRAFNSNGSVPHMVSGLLRHAGHDIVAYPELSNLLRGVPLALVKSVLVDGLSVPRVAGDNMLESGFLWLIDELCAAGAEKALVAALRGARDVDVTAALRIGSKTAGFAKGKLLQSGELEWLRGLSV